jgi:hypothetical protein
MKGQRLQGKVSRVSLTCVRGLWHGDPRFQLTDADNKKLKLET